MCICLWKLIFFRALSPILSILLMLKEVPLPEIVFLCQKLFESEVALVAKFNVYIWYRCLNILSIPVVHFSLESYRTVLCKLRCPSFSLRNYLSQNFVKAIFHNIELSIVLNIVASFNLTYEKFVLFGWSFSFTSFRPWFQFTGSMCQLTFFNLNHNWCCYIIHSTL